MVTFCCVLIGSHQHRIAEESRELWWTLRGKNKALEEKRGAMVIQKLIHETSVQLHGMTMQVEVCV